MQDKLKKDVLRQLDEVIFRHNSTFNTKYNSGNVPLQEIEEYLHFPMFLLNALNYKNLVQVLEAQESDQAQQALEEIKSLAKDKISTAKDELSFWLVEVESTKLGSLLDYLAISEIDAKEVDPKLARLLAKYALYRDAGILNKSDLLAYIEKLQTETTA